MKRTCMTWLAATLLVTSAMPSLSHHSFAVFFDEARTLSISGVVQEFQFRNPHSWIHLDVAGDGKRCRPAERVTHHVVAVEAQLGLQGEQVIDPVAHAVLVLEEHEKSGQEIPDEGLGAETQGDTHDPGGRDERRHVDAQDRQGLQHHPDQYGERDQRLEHGADRGHPLRPPFHPSALGLRMVRRGPTTVLPQGCGGQAPALVGTEVTVVVVVGNVAVPWSRAARRSSSTV